MSCKSCFFIGHREAPASLLPSLIEAIEQHIVDFGVTEFLVGHYGNFDKLAAQAVIAAKEHHPEISLLLVLPYHPAERTIQTPTDFDSTYYPPGIENVPRRFAITRANQYLVDHTDYIIAFVTHPASNTERLLSYAERHARRSQLRITRLPIPGQNLFCQDTSPEPKSTVMLNLQCVFARNPKFFLYMQLIPQKIKSIIR